MANDIRNDREQDGEKLEANEIRLTVDSPFLSKLSNFWYYHKWKVIVILFFAIVFGVGIAQMVTKEDSDEIIVIAAPVTIVGEDNLKLDAVLSSLMPKNSDGSAKALDIYTYRIFSEDEMKEANESETDEDGRYVIYVDSNYNTNTLKEYDTYLTTGESSILFVSPYLYERLVANDRLRNMSDFFGEELPVGVTNDGCGVRLGDTYLYEYFPDMKMLPEDTIICISRQYFHGASSDDEKYAASVEFFKNIVSFGN